ncbi:hypothetical protein BN946_scf184915.g53 [Trametes cinnabarina]|uniref:Terpenoid synthase n=1 Tax=Pycnoporus cinnabarinus TaxID=5643 RepID=A0A060SHK1_PYCCI|nr:hypothetical protein BN946_scf184915.g53 [Trametes cinnabarina]
MLYEHEQVAGPRKWPGRHVLFLMANQQIDSSLSIHQLPDQVHREIQSIIRGFLQECGYKDPRTPRDEELRRYIASDAQSWNVGLSSSHATKIVDTACHLIEAAYAHLSPEHRRYAACFAAYFVYADDLGNQDLEALHQFSRRFIAGQEQLNPVLNRLAQLIRRAHELWTDMGASAIVTGTLEAIVAFHTEFTTRNMVIKPGALRYPDYLRLRSGIDPPFIAFLFMRGWRDTAESYVQLIPDMEFWIGSAK